MLVAKTPQDFINWLETKDPNTKYDWYSTNDCLFARFYRETAGVSLENGNYQQIFNNIQGYQAVGYGQYARCYDEQLNTLEAKASWTYGQALERAKQQYGEMARVD